MKKVFLASIALLLGCTDTGIHRRPAAPPAPATVTVDGTFCADVPADLQYPVKVFFVIDNSNSMGVNDPNDRRFTTTTQFVADNADAAGAILFGGAVFSEQQQGTFTFTEPVFTASAAAFSSQVNMLPATTGGTPYLAALQLANGELQLDVASQPSAARRTRYVVIFLSDGKPTDSGKGAILAEVANMMELGGRVGDITLNTVFLGADDPDAGVLLQDMATLGRGIFKSFPNGDALDYTDFDFEPIRRSFAQRFFLLSNRTALPAREGHVSDSDADGLSDAKELELGTSAAARDTDLDGCSDLMETRDAGWDPLVPGTQNGECDCEPAERTADADSDGLTDCEEKWLNTDPVIADVDQSADDVVTGDLVPDGMDFVALQDVLLPNDGRDYDADGALDLAELRDHTDAKVTDSAEHRERWAYRYDELSQRTDDPRCYDFRVENVSLVRTEATASHGRDENELLLYFAQSPQDDPFHEKLFFFSTRIVALDDADSTITLGPGDFTAVVAAE